MLASAFFTVKPLELMLVSEALVPLTPVKVRLYDSPGTPVKDRPLKVARPPVAVTVVLPTRNPPEELTEIREVLSLAAKFPKRSLSSTTGSIAKFDPVLAPTGWVATAIEAAAAALTVRALLVTEFSEPLVNSNCT